MPIQAQISHLLRLVKFVIEIRSKSHATKKMRAKSHVPDCAPKMAHLQISAKNIGKHVKHTPRMGNFCKISA